MNLGAPELLIVFAAVLLVFGGAKLPALARGLGEARREFDQATGAGATPAGSRRDDRHRTHYQRRHGRPRRRQPERPWRGHASPAGAAPRSAGPRACRRRRRGRARRLRLRRRWLIGGRDHDDVVDDGAERQLATMSGDVASGYTAELDVPV